MGSSCACDGNIVIREEWLEDIVHIETDRIGGTQHVHVNGALIRAVAALDHAYLVQAVKCEPQNCQFKVGDSFIQDVDGRIDEGRNDGRVLAEGYLNEETDDIEDSRNGGAYNCDSNGVQYGSCIVIKNEQYDLAANESMERIDYSCDNFVVIKKECAELINDDMTEDRFDSNQRKGEGCNGGRSMVAEDHWSDCTLTASEDGANTVCSDGFGPSVIIKNEEQELSVIEGIELIDGNQNNFTFDPEVRYGENLLSPGEFKEEIDDGWADDNATNVADGFCATREGGAENDDPLGMVTDYSYSEMLLSPGEFKEEVYDDCDSISNFKVDQNKQHVEDTTDAMVLDEFCTVQATNEIPYSIVLPSFVDSFAREEHVQKHSEKKRNQGSGEKPYGEKYSCDSCSYKAQNFRCFKIHKLTHTGEKPHVCSVCNYATRRRRSLTVHIMNKHSDKKVCEKEYSCNVCSYKAPNPYSLKTHKLIHSGEKAYACPVCNYAFRRVRTLHAHMEKHLGETASRKNSYLEICNVCCYRAATRSSLKTHKLTHSIENSIVCPECSYATNLVGNLKKHMEMQHSRNKSPRKKQNGKNHSCDICSYSALHRSGLKCHERIHSDEKPYVCSVCNFATRQRGNLTTHIMNKHPEKKVWKEYSCDICSYRAPNPYSLKNHKLTHSGEKAYVCPVCNYAFRRVRALHAHMEKHLEEAASRKNPYLEVGSMLLQSSDS